VPDSQSENISKVTEEKEKSDTIRDNLIFDLIKRRYDSEWQRINNLDGKANSLVGYISLVTGFLLGSATFAMSSALICRPVLSSVYFGGIGILIVSIVLALLATRVRKWPNVPNVKVLLESYTSEPYDVVLKTNAATMADAICDIEAQNNEKAMYINRCWYFLIGGLVLVLIFVILFTVTGAEPC
jgi:Na+/phosphate symporter